METSLNDLYQCLLLTTKENEEVVLAPEQLQDAVLCGGKCLIMQLLTVRHYNKDVFKNTLRKAWHLVMGVKFEDLNPSTMLAEIKDGWDKEKVLREGH